MGRGPDDKIAGQAGGTPPVDPELLARPEVLAALAEHDIGVLFGVLNAHGWTQRGIAAATGMGQSEVSEVIRGRRRVGEHRVLVRIAEGLGIARESMKLGSGAYAEEGTGTEATGEVIEEVQRRRLLGNAAAAYAGLPLRQLSEPTGLPAPAPLPSRVFEVHVVQVRNLTRKLKEAGRAYGPNSEVSSATAAWATRLLGVPGAELVNGPS